MAFRAESMDKEATEGDRERERERDRECAQWHCPSVHLSANSAHPPLSSATEKNNKKTKTKKQKKNKKQKKSEKGEH